MKIERHVFTRGTDEGQALHAGFDLAQSLALRHKTGVTFCCEKKKGFQNLLGAIIGQDLAKELFRNDRASTADGVSLALMIPQTFNENAAGVMVALYPRKAWLDRIDDMRHVKAVVLFAFLVDEAKSWAERWGAEKHGDFS